LIDVVTLHEIATTAYFLLSLLLENPKKQLKQPLFWMCSLTLVTGSIAYGNLTAILNWRMDVTALIVSKQLSIEDANKYYVPVAIAGGICTVLMQFFLGMVVLIRTLKLYQVYFTHTEQSKALVPMVHNCYYCASLHWYCRRSGHCLYEFQKRTTECGISHLPSIFD
jgi:hypothetical protein